MSSVSNFIKGGVNLITGNRSRPPSSNSNPKVDPQEEYRQRRRRNNKENSSEVITGVAGVLGAANAVNNVVTNSKLLENIIKQQNTNEIVELTDAVSYSGQQVGNSQSKNNASALSTPVSRYTPVIQMNNSIQPNTFVQRPEPLNADQQQQLQQLQLLQQLQNLQQFFNSQQQIPIGNPTSTLTSLPIPQLIAQASTPRISTPMPNLLPSNASNASNTPSKSNLQIQGTANILNAVSANLVYAGAGIGVNANGSQSITPITSKPASVTGETEREFIAVPHSYFVSNISVSDVNNTNNNNEEEVIINNVNIDNDNIIINILPLTSNNLNIHEGVMLQHQQTAHIEDDSEGMM
jgi:hypothetical protein